MKRQLQLKDVYKTYTRDLDKAISPAETVRRFREKLQALDLDILEETVRIDNGRLDIPVYFSVCGRDAVQTIGTRKQMGKGGTPEQAEASAVMELAERFSFFSFKRDPSNFITDTFDNLEGRALPFDAIARSVHDDSLDLERAREVFGRLPMQWTRAYDLTTGQEVWVPFDWFYAINEFNGPSAGNCVEEALLQGICEVVERHVSSIVSRDRLRVPGIDPASVSDPVTKELLGKFERAGIRVFLSDFSLDTGIPTVGVLAYDPETFPERSEIVWTAGTTPDPHKSLNRALTETAQLAGDFNTGSNYVASGLPKLKDLDEGEFLMHPERIVGIGALPDLSDDNFKVEVTRCLEALAKAGMEVLVVDVTHSQLRIPAFYTIIPGAHFRERAAGTSVGMFTARLMAEKQDPRWAIGELQRMDRILPGKYYVRFFLGLCHMNLGRPQEALGFFEQSLGMDPKPEDVPTIYSYKAQCLKEMEQYREALSALEKAEALDPERTDVHNLAGFCHFKLGEHEEAIACFRKVLRIDPASAIDYANIGSNYREMGEAAKAIQYFRLALDLDPGLDFARAGLERLESGT